MYHRIRHRTSGGRLQNARAVGAVLCAACVASSCRSMLPWSGRGDALSPAQQRQIGVLSWQEWYNAHEPVRDDRQLEAVRRVGQRLATASGRTDLQWQFDMIVDRTPQIVAFPGGKVVVSDALLVLCENEGLLAAAMSHEMGHMLAGHGLERLHRHEVIAKDGHAQPPMPAAAFASGDPARAAPYSPRHEAEADSIALSLMARAGFDPESAHMFWTRITAGQSSPEYSGLARLHAVNSGRLSQMEASLAQARAMYRSSPAPLGTGETLAFDVRRDPRPDQPTPLPTRPNPIAAARIAPSLWTATMDRGTAKPDTWNADLETPDPVTFTALEDRPREPAEQPVRRASFDVPEDDEWLTPIVRPAE
jgi:hypothetical protein